MLVCSYAVPRLCRQLPDAIRRGTVAVSVITQRRIHAEDRIREQADAPAGFAEIIRVDPSAITSTDLFNVPIRHQLFSLRIEHFLLRKLSSSHHASVTVKYLLISI